MFSTTLDFVVMFAELLSRTGVAYIYDISINIKVLQCENFVKLDLKILFFMI